MSSKRKPKPKLWTYVQLRIVQECEDDMTEEEVVEWVKSHFKGCDYGRVEVIASNCIRSFTKVESLTN